MRKIILSLHTTLDGYVGGPNGEMDWIKLDAELFDLVGSLTDQADTALYGRNTYEMMEAYWPSAADQPNASKHDIEHSNWYNKVNKIVLSRTMKNTGTDKLTIVAADIADEIQRIKDRPGKNILIFGSPSAAHSLMQYNLIDDYWLFVNPVILGSGIPMFAKIQDKINLQLQSNKTFSCGVTALNYIVCR